FNNYAIVQGVDQVVPVDVYAPGCPPSPQTLIHAILTLHAKITTGEIARRRSTGEGAGIRLVERLVRPKGMSVAEPSEVPGWVQPPAGSVRLGTPR
ncbi:MAG: hypothetical protein ACRDZ6_02020, partial [Acidimicrobiales bacterium]